MGPNSQLDALLDQSGTGHAGLVKYCVQLTVGPHLALRSSVSVFRRVTDTRSHGV